MTHFLVEGADARYRAAIGEVLRGAREGTLGRTMLRSPHLGSIADRKRAVKATRGLALAMVYFNHDLDPTGIGIHCFSRANCIPRQRQRDCTRTFTIDPRSARFRRVESRKIGAGGLGEGSDLGRGGCAEGLGGGSFDSGGILGAEAARAGIVADVDGCFDRVGRN